MTRMNCFGVVGGDKRQIALAKSLAADGYTVYCAFLDTAEPLADVKKATLHEIAELCDYVILPLPVTEDARTLNAPLCENEVLLDDHFAKLMQEKIVFGGMLPKLYKTSEIWNEIETYDYNERDEFAVRNAVPTAEGAIEIAMHEYPGTINGSKCLVAGFGRIGKVLSHMLKGLEAEVTVSARSPQDLAAIEQFGYHPIQTCKIHETSGYDLIFNTIPAVVFDRKTLSKTAINTILIDLASRPGGVDFEAAHKLSVHVIQALSLPGKVAPKAAAEIIKRTIFNIIEEGLL